jgi:paraquat-inducible protein B
MAVERSYARLGLFLVVVLIVVVGTTLVVVQRLRSRSVIPFVTYTDDNVSGLDVSSPVRYRGVAVGRVVDVRVDPHTGNVEIDFEVFLDRLLSVGYDVAQVKATAALGIFDKVRAQVIGNPVTGDAYLLLDRPANPPPVTPLGFTPTRAYVPSMPTTLSTITDRMPALLDRAETTLRTLTEIIDRVPGSLDRSDRFFTNVERIIRESDIPGLSADSRKFFATTTAQIDGMTANIDKMIGTGGTLVKFADDARAAINAADFPAVSQSTRDAMNQTSLAADDLRRSLPAIRESLEQLRELARLLQEQPESVVYGTRPPKGKGK